MDFVKDMKAKARKLQKRLVLPEGTEPRTLKASRIIVDEKLASQVTLLGKIDEVKAVAAKEGLDLSGIKIVDPATSPDMERYAKQYWEEHHAKDEAKIKAGKEVKHPATLEGAKKDLLETEHWGGMMVHVGDADAMVAGAENSTANMIRSGLDTVGTTSKTASSCFVIVSPDKKWGHDGALIFSDCAVIPEPDENALADIAVAAAQSCREFLDTEPLVALLSFSTKGSADAKFADVGKVQKTVEILKGRKVDFAFDGELQADAALVASVGNKKAPGSPVAGKANTLIFPNLAAGNIGYKLAQRLGNAQAFGPFMQGFQKPIADLSRGCSVDEIVVTSAVTLARAK
jgi:phosphate acetyltransferase